MNIKQIRVQIALIFSTLLLNDASCAWA